MRKRVSDIIVDELIKFGIKQVFMVTGGGAMYLNDAFGRRRDDIDLTFNHHEQACAIAAESYFRASGHIAAINVTTGPGGINALNGVHGAYTDSVPMVVISGQVKRETMICASQLPIRQLGDQEVDIISMVRGITKYAVELTKPERVLEVLDKALFLAASGRPGPVWIDVPVDVQGTFLEESELKRWEGATEDLRNDQDVSPNTLLELNQDQEEELQTKTAAVVDKLFASKRPVMLLGTGVRLTNTQEKLLEIAAKYNIPIVAGWNSYDLIPNQHPCYAGRPSTVGDRAGNFTVQNADFLLVLGSRLNIRQISYNYKSFAEHAYKAQVDIDLAELNKPTLHNDLVIHADLRRFVPFFEKEIAKREPSTEHEGFLNWCKERVRKYPVLQEKHKQSSKVNPYFFMSELFSKLQCGDIVVAANSTAAVVSAQVGEMKEGLRLYSNSGSASMGWELPAAIGAALSDKSKRIICLAGDGSIMMNLQELQTIINYKLNIHIVLLNNFGYLAIRTMQRSHFPDNLFGTDPSNGVSLPDYSKVAEAFGYSFLKILEHSSIGDKLDQFLSNKTPSFVEVILDPGQGFEPKLSARMNADGSMQTPALHDMAPFLSEGELKDNLLF